MGKPVPALQLPMAPGTCAHHQPPCWHRAKLLAMREPKHSSQEDFAGSFINLGPDTVWFNNPCTDCPDQDSICLISEMRDNHQEYFFSENFIFSMTHLTDCPGKGGSCPAPWQTQLTFQHGCCTHSAYEACPTLEQPTASLILRSVTAAGKPCMPLHRVYFLSSSM